MVSLIGAAKPLPWMAGQQEDLLARARDARKREARAQDKRKEEWQAATKSTNLMGVLGASSFGLAQAGELSGTILTEISATRDKAMARVQQMSQAADAPKALSAIAKEHFSGASKHAKSEQSKMDEHYRRLRMLAKFSLLALVVYFILSGARSAYHDALSLVSPAAKELDRVKAETKTPFVVESYDSALAVENAENAENTDKTTVRPRLPSARTRPSTHVRSRRGRHSRKYYHVMQESLAALQNSLESQSIHTRADDGFTSFPSEVSFRMLSSPSQHMRRVPCLTSVHVPMAWVEALMHRPYARAHVGSPADFFFSSSIPRGLEAAHAGTVGA